ncbi:MAG: hypothetical protein ACUVUG_08995 [Candidatus Aminicenantia bacterium]
MDQKIVDFLTKYQYKKSDEILLLQDKIRITESVIKENRALRVVSLNPNNEKSERSIIQYSIGEMEYEGKRCIGVRVYVRRRMKEEYYSGLTEFLKLMKI